ncbi:coiled coil [Cryptosporidium sp. chipmunk genotype I]|uniref:coiled coil n=1 Tax=Cryptosporidium sp. chipmunk genotype I TaxID=1280935 RepID=UPI00351A1F72|nr:coiled coil [Cryptosporidium sp. chipmunk genotype I]
MPEGRKLIQVGKKELLAWGSSLLGEELNWKSFSDGTVLLKFCFIVWPSLSNTKTEIDTLSDSWRKIETIFRTLSIDYSKLIDEEGIKNDKLCSAYNSVIIFFFLYHCAFKNESSFEFIPPPSKQIAEFLMGDSSVKTLIVGGSLQLSPKTQIRLFENDSKAPNKLSEVSNEGVRYFKGDEGVYYDRIQRFNEVMDMDERTVKLVQSLDNFFEGLNDKLSEINKIDLPDEIENFTAKVRHSLEYCVRQMVRTKEEQAIERANFENRIKIMEEDCERKIEQLKLTYEQKIREIENEGKQKIIQEKKASQMMLRTMQNNQTLNLQMSGSIYKDYQNGDLSLEEVSTKIKAETLEQLKYLQEIVNEENKKRDEIEKTLNDEIYHYQKENKRLRYIIYRYVVDISSSTPQFDRLRDINDQFVKIYTLAESWWKKITDSCENVISERSDLNYKMERMRMDEVLGYLKHILDKYQEYPKGLNKVGLNQATNKSSSFEFEVLVQNNHLVNDCLKIVCDLVSESLLKSNRIDQLKDIILNTGNQKTSHHFDDQYSDENKCYCNSNDLFGCVYGKIVCNDEKKHLKEKVQHLNHEKLLLQRGIEFLKKKLYTLKNQQLIVSSENYESNLDLMASIDKPLGETEIDSQEIIQVSDLWDISNYLREDGINDLTIMSEFLVIMNRWKKLFKYTFANDDVTNELKSHNSFGKKCNNHFSKRGVSIQKFNLLPFITSSNKLIEIALENDFSQTEFFEEVKKLESQEFDLEEDFEKELTMISKITSLNHPKIHGEEEKDEDLTFPSSLIKIETMFWKLVTCLHILREEYKLLQAHKISLEHKLETVLAVMEEEKIKYQQNIKLNQEKYIQALQSEKTDYQMKIGKLKAQLTLVKVEKHAVVNKPGKFTVSIESKEKLKGLKRIVETLSTGLEVSNAFRFIYQVSDELWSNLFEILKDHIKDNQVEEKVTEISDQLKGLRQYLKEYSEFQTKKIQQGDSGNEENEDISEYVSSKLMEIGNNSGLGLNIHQKLTSFLKDLALKNNIPLDWLQFIEMIVSAKTIELNNEIDLLKQQITDQDEVISNLKQEYTEISRLNTENESELETIGLERRDLQEKLDIIDQELDIYRSNNELLKEKFKEADLYYTNQLLSCNKRLNCLEKICLLSMDYGVKIQYFRDFYNSKMTNFK